MASLKAQTFPPHLNSSSNGMGEVAQTNRANFLVKSDVKQKFVPLNCPIISAYSDILTLSCPSIFENHYPIFLVFSPLKAEHLQDL